MASASLASRDTYEVSLVPPFRNIAVLEVAGIQVERTVLPGQTGCPDRHRVATGQLV